MSHVSKRRAGALGCVVLLPGCLWPCKRIYPSHCWYAAFLTMPRAGFPGPLFPFAPEASEANGNNEALDGNTEALDGNTDANNASLGSKPRPRATDLLRQNP